MARTREQFIHIGEIAAMPALLEVLNNVAVQESLEFWEAHDDPFYPNEMALINELAEADTPEKMRAVFATGGRYFPGANLDVTTEQTLGNANRIIRLRAEARFQIFLTTKMMEMETFAIMLGNLEFREQLIKHLGNHPIPNIDKLIEALKEAKNPQDIRDVFHTDGVYFPGANLNVDTEGTLASDAQAALLAGQARFQYLIANTKIAKMPTLLAVLNAMREPLAMYGVVHAYPDVDALIKALSLATTPDAIRAVFSTEGDYFRGADLNVNTGETLNNEQIERINQLRGEARFQTFIADPKIAAMPALLAVLNNNKNTLETYWRNPDNAFPNVNDLITALAAANTPEQMRFVFNNEGDYFHGANLTVDTNETLNNGQLDRINQLRGEAKFQAFITNPKIERVSVLRDVLNDGAIKTVLIRHWGNSVNNPPNVDELIAALARPSDLAEIRAVFANNAPYFRGANLNVDTATTLRDAPRVTQLRREVRYQQFIGRPEIAEMPTFLGILNSKGGAGGRTALLQYFDQHGLPEPGSTILLKTLATAESPETMRNALKRAGVFGGLPAEELNLDINLEAFNAVKSEARYQLFMARPEIAEMKEFRDILDANNGEGHHALQEYFIAHDLPPAGSTALLRALANAENAEAMRNALMAPNIFGNEGVELGLNGEHSLGNEQDARAEQLRRHGLYQLHFMARPEIAGMTEFRALLNENDSEGYIRLKEYFNTHGFPEPGSTALLRALAGAQNARAMREALRGPNIFGAEAVPLELDHPNALGDGQDGRAATIRGQAIAQLLINYPAFKEMPRLAALMNQPGIFNLLATYFTTNPLPPDRQIIDLRDQIAEAISKAPAGADNIYNAITSKLRGMVVLNNEVVQTAGAAVIAAGIARHVDSFRGEARARLLINHPAFQSMPRLAALMNHPAIFDQLVSYYTNNNLEADIPALQNRIVTAITRVEGDDANAIYNAIANSLLPENLMPLVSVQNAAAAIQYGTPLALVPESHFRGEARARLFIDNPAWKTMPKLVKLMNHSGVFNRLVAYYNDHPLQPNEIAVLRDRMALAVGGLRDTDDDNVYNLIAGELFHIIPPNAGDPASISVRDAVQAIGSTPAELRAESRAQRLDLLHQFPGFEGDHQLTPALQTALKKPEHREALVNALASPEAKGKIEAIQNAVTNESLKTAMKTIGLSEDLKDTNNILRENQSRVYQTHKEYKVPTRNDRGEPEQQRAAEKWIDHLLVFDDDKIQPLASRATTIAAIHPDKSSAGRRDAYESYLNSYPYVLEKESRTTRADLQRHIEDNLDPMMNDLVLLQKELELMLYDLGERNAAALFHPIDEDHNWAILPADLAWRKPSDQRPDEYKKLYAAFLKQAAKERKEYRTISVSTSHYTNETRMRAIKNICEKLGRRAVEFPERKLLDDIVTQHGAVGQKLNGTHLLGVLMRLQLNTPETAAQLQEHLLHIEKLYHLLSVVDDPNAAHLQEQFTALRNVNQLADLNNALITLENALSGEQKRELQQAKLNDAEFFGTGIRGKISKAEYYKKQAHNKIDALQPNSERLIHHIIISRNSPITANQLDSKLGEDFITALQNSGPQAITINQPAYAAVGEIRETKKVESQFSNSTDYISFNAPVIKNGEMKPNEIVGVNKRIHDKSGKNARVEVYCSNDIFNNIEPFTEAKVGPKTLRGWGGGQLIPNAQLVAMVSETFAQLKEVLDEEGKKEKITIYQGDKPDAWLKTAKFICLAHGLKEGEHFVCIPKEGSPKPKVSDDQVAAFRETYPEHRPASAFKSPKP